MSTLSDLIEQYIYDLMVRARQDMVELQRKELADLFKCAPSQINYVLETRFSVEHGYLVQSRRGGGGYIRIIRMASSPKPADNSAIRIGDRIEEVELEEILHRLEAQGAISSVTMALLRSVIKETIFSLSPREAEKARAALLKNLLFLVTHINDQ
ncbi:MAG: CtsR family transcriptional regulator [Bacillota bacterium]